jgi:hypothetical protein
MLLNDAGSALAVTPRTPGNGLDEHLDPASGGYAQKSEA